VEIPRAWKYLVQISDGEGFYSSGAFFEEYYVESSRLSYQDKSGGETVLYYRVCPVDRNGLMGDWTDPLPLNFFGGSIYWGVDLLIAPTNEAAPIFPVPGIIITGKPDVYHHMVQGIMIPDIFEHKDYWGHLGLGYGIGIRQWFLCGGIFLTLGQDVQLNVLWFYLGRVF